ncbi:hypothetical protein CG723_22505 [Streptomyces sp. CB01635]|uniref:hypothetical protein n=1 Tax=unclassified Streptomyces TaxID=2593676 RepID=UPI000C27BB87|nr:hypothetical protein [Streptomyces sp. CB01635]PJN09521.1 hypothetical protein CG723_22505 [Streptomyces sp. CB01635]
MTVVTLLHADGPPLVMSYWHPVAGTEALAQFGRSRAMARNHGVSGRCGDQLLDNVPANSADRGGAGAVRTANQTLFARLWPRMRPLGSASGLPRTLKRRAWTFALAFSASARDLAVMCGVMDADDVLDADTSAEGENTGKPAPERRPVALKKAGVGPARALFADDSPTGRAGCGPGQGAVCRRAVPRTRGAGPVRGRRLEGHVGVAEFLACLNGGALAAPARYAPESVWPQCRE